MSFDKTQAEQLLVNTGRMCCICHNRHAVSLHHIRAKENGGTDDIDNAIPLCPTCHDEVHGRNSYAPGRTTRRYTESELRSFRQKTIELAAKSNEHSPRTAVSDSSPSLEPRLVFKQEKIGYGGRRGAPMLNLEWTFENIGETAIREYYIDFTGFTKCGYACEFRRRHPSNCQWEYDSSSESDFPWEAKMTEVIHPGREVHLRQLVSLLLKPPISGHLVIRGRYGCDGQLPCTYEKRVSQKSIEKAVQLLDEVTTTLAPAIKEDLDKLLNPEDPK